jgi:acetylxylan esterase
MRVSTTSFLLAAAATGAMAQDNSTCFDGLYIVVVRGTNEEPGPGLFGGIADRLAERVPGSEVLALEYPASLTNPIYAGSVRRGGEALKEAIEEYNDQCPEGRMVVLGYSQVF